MDLPEDEISREDIEFEIEFYNGLIAKQPDFAEALIALGELYTAIGMNKEGLAVDEKLVQIRPDDPIVLYNLACSYSLTGDADKSLRAIKKAVNCGYIDFEHMEQDEDLACLHADKRFQKFLDKSKQKYGTIEKELDL